MGFPCSLVYPKPSSHLGVMLQVGAGSLQKDGRHFQLCDRHRGMATRNAPLETAEVAKKCWHGVGKNTQVGGFASPAN